MQNARTEADWLRNHFPDVDFDVIPTMNTEGGNAQIAIVMASGLDNAHTADQIAAFARDLGIDKNAYKAQQKL
jgi:hypothetical protein